MALIVLKSLGQAQLTGAATVVVAPVGVTYVIKKAVFTNTDTVARTITVYKVPVAGVAGPANVVISAFSLSAGQAYVAGELANMVLETGKTLQAFASVGAVVNFYADGLQQ
jgi:hypothetical protein